MGKITLIGSLPQDHPIYSGGFEIFSKVELPRKKKAAARPAKRTANKKGKAQTVNAPHLTDPSALSTEVSTNWRTPNNETEGEPQRWLLNLSS